MEARYWFIEAELNSTHAFKTFQAWDTFYAKQPNLEQKVRWIEECLYCLSLF